MPSQLSSSFGKDTVLSIGWWCKLCGNAAFNWYFHVEGGNMLSVGRALRFRESELPPSYKDVVSGIPGVLFVGPGAYVEVEHGEEDNQSGDRRPEPRLCKPRSGRFRRHGSRRDPANVSVNATNLDNTSEQVASSSQTITPKRSDTPPPPSYEDVMSLPVLHSDQGECVPMVNVITTNVSG
ncbi:unnamed protein product, partial [Echinostoma caproni]|uniref:Cauli_VI domain-containing protein n=1 Tax=Echinostoma caproni TaxID=27848 RepID=A0A183B5F0_9TREM